jgi:hypothetical protein
MITTLQKGHFMRIVKKLYRPFLFACVCFFISFGVSACGVKPKKLQAPGTIEGETNETLYPRTYPSPSTDPRPE